MTTRIDFHSNVSNQLDYACRLVRKALAAQCQLVVLHQDHDQLTQFDQMLWSFSATDFLPHVDISGQSHPLSACTPVLLTLASTTELSTPQHKILLNLSNEVPAHFAQFQRLIEIVPNDAQATQAGRERYRFYQQRGFPLNHITAK